MWRAIIVSALLGFNIGGALVAYGRAFPAEDELEVTKDRLMSTIMDHDSLVGCLRTCALEMPTHEWKRICMNVCHEDVHGGRQ